MGNLSIYQFGYYFPGNFLSPTLFHLPLVVKALDLITLSSFHNCILQMYFEYLYKLS